MKKNQINGKQHLYKPLSTDEKGMPDTARIAEHTIQIQTNLSPKLQLYVQNFSMVCLTVQQTLNPLMVRAAHKQSDVSNEAFLGSSTVFTTELLRIAMCLLFLCFSHEFRLPEELWNTFVKNKRETLKVCVPALIYVVQNNLYFFALKHVEATLFSITYQLRILTTALLSVLLLRRVFSLIQWSALFISLVGVVLVQYSSQMNRNASDLPNTEAEEKRRNEFVGLITVLVMCWTSAFAGVYLEGVLKKSCCNIWLQNVRLSMITLPFAMLTMAHDRAVIREHGIYYGWTWLVWTIAFFSAASGIVVAAVMKYADNIKKSYCQSMALGGTAFLSIALGDSKFSFILLCGVGLVIASVFLYTTNPYLASPPCENDFEVANSTSSDDEAEEIFDLNGD